ncbi:DUF3397 family protein [Aerococcus sp. 1KP-2016]|uniref:DUF3397 family protein n=1 Tax=Aerococcus sp. 1KP-2016 TaxID=1981982 RepID=UPI000B994EA2|nr:DUF3397 family protein [Aerococcus sp. 1KP-2016]OYQ65887.1 hypothetical protein B9P78_07445 [Aerococcus sp. 1KP-2016]
MAFKWSEILLYVLPIISLVLVHNFGKRYLLVGNVKLASVDPVQPILLVCLHFISTYVSSFSWVAHVIMVFSLIAIILLVMQFIQNEPIHLGKMARKLSNILFCLAFGAYAIATLVRIFQVVTATLQ